MGLLSVFTGNATEVSAEKLDKLLEELSAPGEEIEKAYQLVRDMIVFTNLRVMMIDKQGVTGGKAEILSIPYGKITKFSKESSSLFDMDAELRIWVGSEPEPIKRQFGQSVNINEVYSILSSYVLQ